MCFSEISFMNYGICISIGERRCDFFFCNGGRISATASLNRILKLVFDCKRQQIEREKKESHEGGMF